MEKDSGLFDSKLYFKVFALLLLVAIAGLAAALWLFNYPVTPVDTYGTIISTAIIANMVQLWYLSKRN